MRLEFVKIEEHSSKQGNKFVSLTISRPQALNALNAQVLKELSVALDTISKMPYRVLILIGEGKSFVAGADISEFQNITSEEAFALSKHGQEIFSRIEKLEIPTIAAINGFALGGGLELALSCDFIVASNKAKWGLPEVSLGLIPGYGGTQRLARKCGESVAKRVALSGEMFTAEQGFQYGLFSSVVEAEKLMDSVMATAELISDRAPIAVRMTKACIDGGVELGSERGFALEARSFSEVFKTQDKSEGVKAFLEKRPPNFEGK